MKHQFDDTYYERVLELARPEIRFDQSSLNRIGDYENMIYECRIDGVDRIIRITDGARRSEALLTAELDWIVYLRENNVPVSSPLPIFDGGYLFSAVVNDAPFFVSLFEMGHGLHAGPDDWTDAFVQKFGQIMGKMHTLSTHYKPASGRARRSSWYETVATPDGIDVPADLEIAYKKLADVVAKIRSAEPAPNTFGLIHSDLNFGNFKIENGRITIFDFDDCCYAWFVQDIAVLLFDSVSLFCPQGEQKAFIQSFLKNFLIGYEPFRVLETHEWELLALYTKLREIELFIELYGLPTSEQYDHEQRFMLNRRAFIENDVPFIELSG